MSKVIFTTGATSGFGATKAFVRQFSANFCTDLTGNNIRVNDIEPMCQVAARPNILHNLEI